MLKRLALSLPKKLCNTQIRRSSYRCVVSVDEIDGIRNIVLDDPKTRNSLSMSMMNQLIEEIKRDDDDKDLRVILLQSTGPVFSAGHNLKELSPDKSYEEKKSVFDKCHELIKCIIDSPVPVVCKVDGLAAAAGLQLVASCDITVCSISSTFSTPGSSFGIFCSTPGIALRVIPRMKSSYMLLTGLPITSDEALRVGLVSSVVPREELNDEAEKICNAIKSKSRAVVTLGKKFYYEQLGMGLNEAYKAGSKIMADNLELYDGKEGIKSFIEKRKPVWKDE
ncbi:enoyl-CoA hydratase domain-containing protein 3, mitochondrial [Chironomus tepperi]|uniref:enoyl-CoA hydratase domain-containing protein 3, mitochondrial n=1 Tax=Chironomus tepperi TaxID=113505 RepID=UPI00391F935E